MDHDQFNRYLQPADQRPEENRRNTLYNTEKYYRNNLEIGDSRYPSRYDRHHPEDKTPREDEEEHDEINTGKYESYNGEGYYGSRYGQATPGNIGRDYAQNAGYRDSYNRLPTGQWPEVEEASLRRRQQDLAYGPAGGHKGKGPRSYRRSDLRIMEDINDRLTEDAFVDATEIEVRVENGEVTLEGTVADTNMKRRAGEVAESVQGISHLENRLHTNIARNRSVNIRNH